MQESHQFEKKLKYKLNEFLYGYDPETRKKIVKAICDQCGFTENSLYRYRAAKLGQKKALNSDQLVVIAGAFGCTVDELIIKKDVTNKV